METKLEGYKRYFYMATVIIALGVIFSTTLRDAVGSLGSVFIAIGALLFIVALSKKRKEAEQKNK